jgi:multiple sugar transport system substrate-binding protein
MRVLRVLALLSIVTLALAQEQTVSFAGWSLEEEASRPTIQKMIRDFETGSPSLKVQWQGWPWSQVTQNLVLRVRSNQAPQVAQLQERWLPIFANLDTLTDLNTVYSGSYLRAQIDPGLLALGQWKGKQLGIPWTAGSIGMVANDRVLREAGVRAAPKTIDEFVTALRAVKRTNPNSVPYGLSTKNSGSISPDFQIWLWTFGGRLFTEDDKVAIESPEAVRALTFMTNLVKDGLAARDIDRPDSRRLFGQNNMAFYFDAPLARGFARTNSGQGKAVDAIVSSVATPVLRIGDTPRSLAWGHLLVMFKQPTPVTTRSAGARLISYLAFDKRPQLEYFNAVGLFPTSRFALSDPTVRNDRYLSTWSRNSKSALRDEPSNFVNSGDMVAAIGEEVQASLLGQKTPEDAIKSLAARLRTLVAQAR